MISRILKMAAALIVAAVVCGCQAASNNAPLLSKKSPVELRAMQDRIFDTADRERVLRGVIATFQDLGYGLNKVNATAGTVTGTKLAILKLSASVFPRGASRVVVRANALVRVEPHWYQVDAPDFYQKDFFGPLSRSLFLTPEQMTFGGKSATHPASGAPGAAHSTPTS